MEMLYIGSHVSLEAPDYFLGSVKEALGYGANTFMLYTGAPQNSIRKNVLALKIAEGQAAIKEAGIDPQKIIVHAPYIVNLGNSLNPELFIQSVKFLKEELRRVEAFGLGILVLHPGSHVQAGPEIGLKQVVFGLNEVMNGDTTHVKIALETMAGKGSEVGATFEEIHYLLEHVEHKDRFGVCLDTCHISDGGYDVAYVEGVLAEFDRVVGLNKLLCMHINDSKNIRGAHKDRHENLGYGEIGFEVINHFVHHPKLTQIPKILETPYVGEKPPYKEEIAMLRSGVFIPGWREKL
jgi:deoxyribonuclease IV